MGFFDLHATCGHCNKDIGLNRYRMRQLDTKWLCSSCHRKLNASTTELTMKLEKDEIHELIESFDLQKTASLNFVTTQKCGLVKYSESTNQLKINSKVINVADILSYEILEDGSTVTSGGLGKAIATDILINPVAGILVGATAKRKSKTICTKLKIKITINDMYNPCLYIDYILFKTKKESHFYKKQFEECQKVLSFLEVIVNKNNVPLQNTITTQPEDETSLLRKYKQLFDDNIISEDEFNAKKREILNIG